MTELRRELQKETSRRGYWIAIGLVVVAMAIVAVTVLRMFGQIEAMPRIQARGEHVVDLPAGDLVVFAELTNATAMGPLRCAAMDASGAQLPFTSMGANSISYDTSSYHGQSIFGLDVPAAGRVTVRCETDDDVVLAFGKGMGSNIAIGLALSMPLGLAGCFIWWRTFARRRRERKAHAARASHVDA